MDNNQPTHPENRTYPVLNFIAAMFKIMGVLTAIAGIVSAINYTSHIDLNDVIAPSLVIGGLWLGLCFFAMAELIKVATNISSDTYQVLKHLKSNNNEKADVDNIIENIIKNRISSN